MQPLRQLQRRAPGAAHFLAKRTPLAALSNRHNTRPFGFHPPLLKQQQPNPPKADPPKQHEWGTSGIRTGYTVEPNDSGRKSSTKDFLVDALHMIVMMAGSLTLVLVVLDTLKRVSDVCRGFMNEGFARLIDVCRLVIVVGKTRCPWRWRRRRDLLACLFAWG